MVSKDIPTKETSSPTEIRMATKTELLKYIDRLEQDRKRHKRVQAFEDENTGEENDTPISAILIDTDSPEDLVAQFLVAAQQIDQ